MLLISSRNCDKALTQADYALCMHPKGSRSHRIVVQARASHPETTQSA